MMDSNQVECCVAQNGSWLDLKQSPSNELIEHIEGCATCQQRLRSMAADEGFWERSGRVFQTGFRFSEASIFGVDIQGRDAAQLRDGSPRWTEAMTKQMLGPASHPEMLGRIGRYEVERLVGAGGMGVVFKAHDTELNRAVAIKLLAPHLAQSKQARERFAREAQAAAGVVDDHVVPIYNVESQTEYPYLVMQFIAGGSLQDQLDDDPQFDLEEILRIGMQTARGLAAAHKQGLVHRDAKPANILLDENTSRAVLTDFGLARASESRELTESGMLIGTPQYMSPEQVKGDELGEASDLFSLGCILYAMSVGKSPFQGPNRISILRRIVDDEPEPLRCARRDFPLWFDRFVMTLLQKEPSRRPQTAEHVAESLEEALAHVRKPSVCPLPISLRSTPSTSGRRYLRKPVAWLCGTLSMLLVAMAIGTFLGAGQDNSSGSFVDDNASRNAIPPAVAVENANEESAAVVLVMHPAELSSGNSIQRRVTESTIKQLRTGDELGHLSYSTGGPSWLWEGNSGLRRIDSSSRKNLIKMAGSSQTGDLPSFDLVLQMSLDALRVANSERKRVLIFTDGDPVLNRPKLLEEIAQAGIVIDVCHVEYHSETYRTAPLRIANTTGGKYFRVQPEVAVDAVPKLFRRQIQELIRPNAMDTRAATNTAMQRIALAFHRFQGKYGKFPGTKNIGTGSDGITGQEPYPFSWRVAILPFIGEKALYDQYRFDEPWDSTANRLLLAKMPMAYGPQSVDRPLGFTHFLGIASASGALGTGSGELLSSFTDGLSKTILVIETSESVPWTQPKDLNGVSSVSPLLGSEFRFVYSDGSLGRLAEERTAELKQMASRYDETRNEEVP